jgi:hypothetical protein
MRISEQSEVLIALKTISADDRDTKDCSLNILDNTPQLQR